MTFVPTESVQTFDEPPLFKCHFLNMTFVLISHSLITFDVTTIIPLTIVFAATVGKRLANPAFKVDVLSCNFKSSAAEGKTFRLLSF